MRTWKILIREAKNISPSLGEGVDAPILKKRSSSIKVISDGNSEMNLVKKRAVELDKNHLPISSAGAVFLPFPNKKVLILNWCGLGILETFNVWQRI